MRRSGIVLLSLALLACGCGRIGFDARISSGDACAACVGDGALGMDAAYDGAGRTDGAMPTDAVPPGDASVPGAVHALALGTDHSCVLVAGAAWCWGYNRNGQLGDGTQTLRTSPMAVTEPLGAVELVAGNESTYARAAPGVAASWGANALGQLGDGTITESWRPVVIVGRDLLGLASGDVHACARRATDVVCWGDNFSGQLGVEPPTPRYRTTLEAVMGAGVAVEIAAGGSHTCVRRATGAVECWGWNGYGQLGDGTTVDHATPAPVPGVDNAIAIAAGDGHSCAVLATGEVMCWGPNSFGEIGDGSKVARPSPTFVMGIEDATLVAAGYYFTCAIRSGGAVSCWGQNNSGQIGNGTTAPNQPVPAAVVGLSGVVEIRLGGFHACALTALGRVLCWGDNTWGQLGNGTRDSSPVPITVGLPGPAG